MRFLIMRKLLDESSIINALHKRQMARMNEELQDNIRHQEVPYHEDVDNEIVPENVEGTEDEDNSWLDNSFAYQCPKCAGYFTSPEQLGNDEEVDCPHCGSYVVPDECDDFDFDDYELEDDEEEDEEDEELDDSEDDFDEDDEEDDFDDDEDLEDEEEDDFDEAEKLYRNGKKLSPAQVKAYRKHQKKRNQKGIGQGFELINGKKKKLSMAQKKHIKQLSKGSNLQHRIKAVKKANRKRGINSSTDLGLNDNFVPYYLNLEEDSVISVLNKVIKEAFADNEEDYIPFEVTEITEGFYYEDSDRLDFDANILYEDGEEDSAEFSVSGFKSGNIEIKENTEKLDFPKMKIVGSGAIVNEQILIN